MTVLSTSAASPSRASLHAGFLALLPRIQRCAGRFFRRIGCTHHRDDCIAEVVALAWYWYVRLRQRGKDPEQFASILASFVARAVGNSRRLTGRENGQDVLSPRAQRRHGFGLRRLLGSGDRNAFVWEEAVQDNTQAPVPDQVCFRCDFPVWYGRRSERDRRLIDDLMRGETTAAAARTHGLTAGRVSQLRRAFLEDWERFCAVPEAADAGCSTT